MKEGDKITVHNLDFPKCGCWSSFQLLQIGKEYTIMCTGNYDFADAERKGSVPVIALKDSPWGGWYPLSLFQPKQSLIGDSVYEIY